jgi:hypothetical protein
MRLACIIPEFKQTYFLKYIKIGEELLIFNQLRNSSMIYAITHTALLKDSLFVTLKFDKLLSYTQDAVYQSKRFTENVCLFLA